MSGESSDQIHWPGLPQEIRDRVLDFVFADRIFIHSARGTVPAFPVCQVSKQFATQEQAINAILRSGKIRINDVPDLKGIIASLTPVQRSSGKTLTISQSVLKRIGSI